MRELLNRIISALRPEPVVAPMLEPLEGRSMLSAAVGVEAPLDVEGGAAMATTATMKAAVKRITEPKTGLSVAVPAGYRLSQKGGVYKLTNGRLYVKFMLARSPLTMAQTRASFVKLAKLGGAKLSGTGKTLKAEGTLAGKRVVVQFKQVAKGLFDIATFGRMGGSASAGQKAGTPVVTVADIAALQRILNTRRGGVSAPLQVAVPMRRFTSGDGGATALVPNLPGWTYSGGQGILNGGAIGQGFFNLGVPVAVGLPGSGAAIQNALVDPGTAIAQIWPQYNLVFLGAQVQVTNVQFVPGTAGWLGPNFNSGLFAIRFVAQGHSWQGLMSSGTFDMGLALGFGWQYSVIAVAEDGPGGIGPALINTWATWNNAVASQQRLNQALATVLSTDPPGGPIDPDVFERAANAWSIYIRGEAE